MTTVIERHEGHYKVHKLPYGIDYVWCPRCVFVECDCGERLMLSASLTTCGCGADHAALVREELASRRPSEEVSHPLEDEVPGVAQQARRVPAFGVLRLGGVESVRVIGEGEHRQRHASIPAN
jgi:hypothetical protein